MANSWSPSTSTNRLVPIGEVERLDGEIDQLLHVLRCQHDHLEIAVAAPPRRLVVAVLPRPEAAVAGTPPLLHHDDAGQLGHSREERQRLRHQAEPERRCRGHRPEAGEAGAGDHVDGGDLAFGRHHHPIVRRELLGSSLEDLGCRGDRDSRRRNGSRLRAQRR